VKRTRHTRSTISRSLALSVTIAALAALAAVAAVTAPASAATASMPRWAAAADSGATPPPAPASSDTVQASPQAPAPAIEAAPAVAPAVAAAAAAPALTKKQAKQKKKADQLAADAAKPPKPKKMADVDPLADWNAGVSWLMVRAGYARSGEPGASGAGGGVALGYQRFLTARWAIGLIAQGDLLGKFGGAAEIEYPVTLEFTRHYRWKTALRPYLGAGGGAYCHKYFRTGNDFWQIHSGAYFVGGFNAPVSKRSIIGIDGRMQFVSGDQMVNNPVFGPEDAQLTHYSLKLGWSMAF
jgi:hypothetical protein